MVIETDPTPADVKELVEDEGLNLPDFDLSEVTLPHQFLVELMGSQALQNIKTLLVTRYNIAANKAAHNDPEVKRLTLLEVSAREALRRIKRDYPEAIALATDLATDEVVQARQIREGR